MILWIFWMNLTFAEAPTAVVDGTVVRGQALLPLTPDRILAQLRDPAWEGLVSGNFASAVVQGQEGDCQLVAYVAPNVVLEARYTLKRCPTADGFQATLVNGNAFTHYDQRWKVQPEGQGSRVIYEVDLGTSLWVPAGFVRSETRRGVQRLVDTLDAWADREKAGG